MGVVRGGPLSRPRRKANAEKDHRCERFAAPEAGSYQEHAPQQTEREQQDHR